jgi:hypothetical protein
LILDDAVILVYAFSFCEGALNVHLESLDLLVVEVIRRNVVGSSPDLS